MPDGDDGVCESVTQHDIGVGCEPPHGRAGEYHHDAAAILDEVEEPVLQREPPTGNAAGLDSHARS